MAEDAFFYIDCARGGVFARFREGAGSTQGWPVLLLPPFGWEELSAHRALRTWSRELSDRGHSVLTIDFPGQGDSSDPIGPRGQWAAWQEASLAAAAWLRSASGDRGLTVVGLRLGGLMAYHVAAANAAEQLVLWATPGSGRRAHRELKAFSVLESAQIVASGGPEPPSQPADCLAPGGFLIDGIAARELEGLELAPLSPGSGLRALILGNDGQSPDSALTKLFEQAEVEITVGAGVGLGSMLAEPDQSEPPWVSLGDIQDWIEAEPPLRTQPPPPPPPRQPARRSRLDLERHRERPVTIPSDSGHLVGIASEFTPGPAVPTTAVFLNAGAVRRIGPHRLWVETARRWAASGVASLRVDLPGIGDSDGDHAALRDVANFHTPSYPTHVGRVLDQLEREGLTAPFLLAGLCSGGHWAFQTALQDPRVGSILLINPRILHWDPEIDVRRDLRRTRTLGSARAWQRLLRGEVSRERWVAAAGSLARAPGRSLRRKPRSGGAASVEEQIARSFDVLRDRGQQLSFVFCDGEPLREELDHPAFRSRESRWPNITIELVPGRDHTLRPVWMHPHVDRAVDAALRRHVERHVGVGRLNPSPGVAPPQT